MSLLYCVDACSLLRAYYEAYPPRRFPSFWTRVDALVAAGRFLVPRDVCEEVKQKDDALYKLLQGYEGVVRDVDRPQAASLKILANKHAALINHRKLRSQGDPFVIALAHSIGGTVVTEEGEGSPAKPKIPDVCKALSVDCINLLGMIDAEGWDF